MSSAGLSIGTTALAAQRAALDTAGNNIANANTDGYTRQRVNLSATGAGTVPAFWSRYIGAGTGVQVSSIDRITDRFLELRTLQEHATDSSLQQTKNIMGEVESAFNEPSDTGLQAQMADFWSSWDDVANNPTDLPARTAMLEKAQTLTAGFQHVAGALDDLKATALDQVTNDATQVNGIAHDIAKLNQAIQTASNGGLQANNLLDQRDSLLKQLTQLVGVSTQTGDNGMLDVFVGSTALVRGTDVNTVHIDTSGPVALKWDNDGTALVLKGGTDQGLLQAINVDIPKYRNALNAVATNFRDAVNQQHEQGVDLNSAPSGTPSNRDLINPPGVATGTVDAALISVANLTPDQIAAAGVNGGRMDGSNAAAIANLTNAPGGPDQAYRSLVSSLGVDVQRANNQADIQSEVTKQTDAAVQSTSGVNIDEEMTNMLNFQHGYEAAAKYLSVVSDTMQTLIDMVR